MKPSIFARPACLVAYAAVLTATLTFALAFAQDQESWKNQTPISVAVTEPDVRAAANVTNSRVHVTPAHLPGAREVVQMFNDQFGAGPRVTTVPSPTPPAFYPADLASGSGIKIVSAVSHAVYVNCTTIATCWGNPEGFLIDLGKSNFIHLLDQYVGSTANNRYTDGAHVNVGYSIFGNTLYPHDIFAIVHAAAKLVGAGNGHIYHIFLPSGTDTCFDQSGVCYSPDNPASNVFCAYHESVTFSDIGHVLYTVEPFQDVDGCRVATPSPNGQLADSTNSGLSHEFFETVTDPNPPSGFINRVSLLLVGAEIGDECVPLANASGALVPTFLINGKNYEVQTEYSNHYHACAVVP